MRYRFRGANYKLEYSGDAGGKAHPGNHPGLPSLNSAPNTSYESLVLSSAIHTFCRVDTMGSFHMGYKDIAGGKCDFLGARSRLLRTMLLDMRTRLS